jgi:hypothetical protein
MVVLESTARTDSAWTVGKLLVSYTQQLTAQDRQQVIDLLMSTGRWESQEQLLAQPIQHISAWAANRLALGDELSAPVVEQLFDTWLDLEEIEELVRRLDSRAAEEAGMSEATDCECVVSCSDDPPTACSLSGEPHVHPEQRCPVHPDAPGDWA